MKFIIVRYLPNDTICDNIITLNCSALSEKEQKTVLGINNYQGTDDAFVVTLTNAAGDDVNDITIAKEQDKIDLKLKIAFPSNIHPGSKKIKLTLLATKTHSTDGGVVTKQEKLTFNITFKLEATQNNGVACFRITNPVKVTRKLARLIFVLNLTFSIAILLLIGVLQKANDNAVYNFQNLYWLDITIFLLSFFTINMELLKRVFTSATTAKNYFDYAELETSAEVYSFLSGWVGLGTVLALLTGTIVTAAFYLPLNLPGPTQAFKLVNKNDNTSNIFTNTAVKKIYWKDVDKLVILPSDTLKKLTMFNEVIGGLHTNIFTLTTDTVFYIKCIALKLAGDDEPAKTYRLNNAGDLSRLSTDEKDLTVTGYTKKHDTIFVDFQTLSEHNVRDTLSRYFTQIKLACSPLLEEKIADREFKQTEPGFFAARYDFLYNERLKMEAVNEKYKFLKRSSSIALKVLIEYYDKISYDESRQSQFLRSLNLYAMVRLCDSIGCQPDTEATNKLMELVLKYFKKQLRPRYNFDLSMGSLMYLGVNTYNVKSDDFYAAIHAKLFTKDLPAESIKVYTKWLEKLKAYIDDNKLFNEDPLSLKLEFTHK